MIMENKSLTTKSQLILKLKYKSFFIKDLMKVILQSKDNNKSKYNINLLNKAQNHFIDYLHRWDYFR
jgi:hypothetical protein